MKASHFSKDIHQFLELLAKHKVKYVIVGGEAVIYYGYARLTGDVDFFFGTSKENPQCLYDALDEFWGGDIPGVDSFEEVMQSGTILQFGVPPNRIDLVNHIDGVTFEEAWTGKTTTSVEISGKSIPVHSPSPEYPAACCRDEWRGDRAVAHTAKAGWLRRNSA